jgi:very-short-patch-repair endonuclease
MAAVLACGEGAVLSHRAAAHLHNLRPTDRHRIDVTVPRRTKQSHESVDVHTSTTLSAADITTVDGIPCTTVARTYLDLGDVAGVREVERALERGEMLGIADARTIDDQLARNPTRAAARRLRAALSRLRADNAPTENDFEEDLLALCRRAGLPEPRRQFYVDPGDGEPAVRADFAWPAQKLIVETDGRQAHGTRSAFESDRRRDQRLMLIGWRVVRITWRQLKYEPWRVEALLLGLE